MSITYFRLQLDSTDERWSPLWPVSKEPRHTYLNDIRKLSGLESCVKFYSNKLEGFMTKLNHSSTDVIVCCVKFYSNRLECFLTKLNHSSTEFTDETLNKTLCWEEQGSHPITTQNKSSHSQHWVRPPLASVQAWLALFSVNEHTSRASRKALAHTMSPWCSKVGAFSPVNAKDHIRAENKLQSIPQAMKHCTQILNQISSKISQKLLPTDLVIL